MVPDNMTLTATSSCRRGRRTKKRRREDNKHEAIARTSTLQSKSVTASHQKETRDDLTVTYSYSTPTR